MSGLMVRHAPHLDGSEDIGVWVDVAWAVYLEAGTIISTFNDKIDSLNEMWENLIAEPEEATGDGRPSEQERQRWGASERAQRGQEALMSMFGGGLTGMSPEVGGEA